MKEIVLDSSVKKGTLRAITQRLVWAVCLWKVVEIGQIEWFQSIDSSFQLEWEISLILDFCGFIVGNRRTLTTYYKIWAKEAFSLQGVQKSLDYQTEGTTVDFWPEEGQLASGVERKLDICAQGGWQLRRPAQRHLPIQEWEMRVLARKIGH